MSWKRPSRIHSVHERTGVSWKRTGRELLHKGPFLSLYRDSVIRPDGSAGTYEHVITKDSVRVAAIDEEGSILLVEDDFYLQERGILHLPGGGVEDDFVCAAAERELEEETGMKAGKLHDLATIEPLPGITAARVHLFAATDLKPGQINRDSTEINMTVKRWPLGVAIDAVQSGKITEGGSVAAILLTAAYLGRR